MLVFSLVECMLMCSSVLLVALLLTGILDWTQLFTWAENDSHPATFSFGYAYCNGPHTWKNLYPESTGNNQSPINIISRLVVIARPAKSLCWSNHNDQPLSMTVTNDGHTVILQGFWRNYTWPWLQGGPLSDAYDFLKILFHWGPSNDEGSEHTVDYVRYPMELQAIYTKRGLKSPSDAIVFGAKDNIAILSFFLQVEQFRKICSVDGPLLLNCRPVQPLNDRDVYFYEESE